MEENMNSKTLEKLGYIEIKEQLKTYCTSDLGKQKVEDLIPTSNIKKIEQQLLETTEALNIINNVGSPPFLGTIHIVPIIKKLEKRSEEHTSELQSRFDLVCRVLLEQKKH